MSFNNNRRSNGYEGNNDRRYNKKPYNNNNSNSNYDNKRRSTNFKGSNNVTTFKNTVRFSHADPTTFAERAVADYYADIDEQFNPEYVTKFRSQLLDNYHLYKISVSDNNHFTSGHSIRFVGWMAATKEDPAENGAINVSIWMSPEVEMSRKAINIVYFNAIKLAGELFCAFGRACRICMDYDFYKANQKYFPDGWVIDAKNRKFNNVFGNLEDEKTTILIDTNIGKTVNIGSGVNVSFTNIISDKFDNCSVKLTPIGAKIFDSEGLLIATVRKCNKKKEMFVYCAEEHWDTVEEIVRECIEIENADHKHPYDPIDKIKIIPCFREMITDNSDTYSNNEDSSEDYEELEDSTNESTEE